MAAAAEKSDTSLVPGKVTPLNDYRTVMAQRAIFQGIASMGLPAFTIHSIVRYSGRAMKDVKNVRLRTWGPIGLGLAAVPALPFLFDKPVEEAVEWVFVRFSRPNIMSVTTHQKPLSTKDLRLLAGKKRLGAHRRLEERTFSNNKSRKDRATRVIKNCKITRAMHEKEPGVTGRIPTTCTDMAKKIKYHFSDNTWRISVL